MGGLCLAQAHMALDLLLLVDETCHLSREIMINAKHTYKRQRQIHCRWGIYEKFDRFGGSYVRSYVTFPLFISVILRFKQVVPFPSFSRWYRLQVIPFLFDLLLFSHSVVYSALWPHGLHHARLPCPSPSPELAQTHVLWVSDAIQPSHPLSSPSPAFSLSQHQGSFWRVSSSHQVA